MTEENSGDESANWTEALSETVSGLMRVRDTLRTLNKIQADNAKLGTDMSKTRTDLEQDISKVNHRLTSLASALATMHPDQPLLQKLADPDSLK